MQSRYARNFLHPYKQRSPPYNSYISKKAYFEKQTVFAQKYREYAGDEPADILAAAAECASYDPSPLKKAGYDLLKQQDNSDFEMYRLERSMLILAENCVTKQ